MRVLMVAPLGPEGAGIGLYSHSIIEALRQLGAEVLPVPISSSDGHGLNCKPPQEFARIIREGAAGDSSDIVHLQYEPGLLSLGQAKAIAQNPPRRLVVTLHRVAAYDGTWTISGLRQGRAVWMERNIAKAATLLVVHSEHSHDVVKHRYPKAECVVQPMPVPPDNCAVRRPRDGYVLFFGIVHPGKGVLGLVRAMKLLPDLACTISGPEDPRWAKHNTALSAEIAGTSNVTREGGEIGMKRKHELFSGCSCVALPYTAGGFGSAVLQDAIAHERPVAAGAVQPLADMVNRLGVGASGATNPRALAENIRKVMTDNSSIYAAALADVRKRHAPLEIAKLLLEKYFSVTLGQRRWR